MSDPEPSPLPPETPPARRPTVREETLIVLFLALAALFCFGWQLWSDFSAPPGIRTHVFDSLGGLLIAIGNTTWIFLDRRRRGREVGGWPIASLFCGPAALVLYLIHEYREQAFFLIPILVGVYAALMFLPGIAVHLLRLAWL